MYVNYCILSDYFVPLFTLKHFGSKCDFNSQRDQDLLRAFRNELAICDSIHMEKIAKRIAISPSCRFWVSEERALNVVNSIRQGKTLDSMRPTKRRMFTEIYKRFMSLLESNPDASPTDLIYKVVNSPAPEFYMTWKSIVVILHRARKTMHISKRYIP